MKEDFVRYWCQNVIANLTENIIIAQNIKDMEQNTSGIHRLWEIMIALCNGCFNSGLFCTKSRADGRPYCEICMEVKKMKKNEKWLSVGCLKIESINLRKEYVFIVVMWGEQRELG